MRLSPKLQEAVKPLLRAVGTQLTPEFEEALFDQPREKIVFGGWRAGKSRLGASDLLIDWFINQAMALAKKEKPEPRLYWIVGPDYTQAVQEFLYLFEWFSMQQGWITNVSNPIEGSKSLTLLDGSKFETKTAQAEERLGSVAPHKILACEAGQFSEEARLWLRGRSMEKRAQIIYTGTLEDEEAHKQWAWYMELGTAWMEDRNDDHAAYSLPSWANTAIYPGGRDDPEIVRTEADLKEQTGSDYAFLRRIAGVPAGSPYQVYPQLTTADLLRPIPEGTKFIRHVGGIDFGTVHPSALTIIGITAENVAWVRECVVNEGSTDSQWVKDEHARLSRTYNCWLWGTDPNEKFMARSFKAEAVSGSAGSREARVALTSARLNRGLLMFDVNGPGVPDLHAEMMKVHRKKLKTGELVYDRTDDDRTASMENGLELADGSKSFALPRSVGKRTYRPQPKRRQAIRI